MNDISSLILLADVALHTSSGITPFRNRKETKSKKLVINNVNGEYLAELKDLKCLSISFLSKIFFERFEDKKSHRLIYVCKFGVKTCCNTKFKDASDGKIQRLEHLIQCHLLQHLMKTKPNAMVKIPKRSVELENVHFQASELKLTEDCLNRRRYLESNLRENVIKETDFHNFSSDAGKKRENNTAKKDLTVKSDAQETKTTSKLININVEESIEAQSLENGLIESESSATSIEENSSYVGTTYENRAENISQMLDEYAEKLVIPKVVTKKFVNDHSYATVKVNIAVGQVETAYKENRERRIDKQNVNINNLYYLNSEPSRELSNFIIAETLNKQNHAAVMSENGIIYDELPVIGSEVEITADYNVLDLSLSTMNKLNNNSDTQIKDQMKIKFWEYCENQLEIDSYFLQKTIYLHIIIPAFGVCDKENSTCNSNGLELINRELEKSGNPLDKRMNLPVFFNFSFRKSLSRVTGH